MSADKLDAMLKQAKAGLEDCRKELVPLSEQLRRHEENLLGLTQQDEKVWNDAVADIKELKAKVDKLLQKEKEHKKSVADVEKTKSGKK